MLLQRSASPGPSGLGNSRTSSPKPRLFNQESPRLGRFSQESPRLGQSSRELPNIGLPRLEADGATAETVKLEQLQENLKEGWTVHIGREGRLYYCNHKTRSAGWLPPKESWDGGKDSEGAELPYGWEKASDCKGQHYYINHLNKTTTYVAPENRTYNEPPPEPRDVVLERSAEFGFGFVAGSEKPVVVRFVTENSPSAGKLEPGDEIWCINGEDVRNAAREHVITTVRACSKTVSLRVCQPSCRGDNDRRGALLSPGKRARLRARPSRVRFADSVQVNGAPLYPPSAFSLGDLCLPPMANVLKVFLENGQTKSFKYDTTTTVGDVFTSLTDKLCIEAEEYFSLVVEHVKSLRRNKLTLLDPSETLARIASRPGAHKMRCLFRVSFAPLSVTDLAQRDANALDYLYLQCTNDVAQERFAPELQPDVTLKLAALHMYQHAMDNHFSSKLSVKAIEHEFGLERFIPTTLLESMKKKELRRILTHFLKVYTQPSGTAGQQKPLTQLQAKLHYLDIISSLPSYGAKCFSCNQPDRVLLISPRFGLSQIIGMRSTVPQPIANLDEIESLRLEREDELSYSLTIFLQRDRVISFSMEDRDASEMALVLTGYFKLVKGEDLKVEQEREPINEDIAPPYVSQHDVMPAKWSYINYEEVSTHKKPHYSIFSMPPPYHSLPAHQNILDSNMNGTITNKNQAICNGTMNGYGSLEKAIKSNNFKLFDNNDSMIFDDGMGFDINSVLSLEMLENFKDNPNLTEAKNEEVLKRMTEMHKLVESSEKYLNENGELVDNDAYSSFYNDHSLLEQESCVDQLESDSESNNTSEDAPGILKHSDSLILLTESINQGLNGLNIANNRQDEKSNDCQNLRQSNGLSAILNNCGLTEAINVLNNDLSQSESDNDSSYTPTNSPIRRHVPKTQTKRTSFEIHSPDQTKESNDQNLKVYLQQLREKAYKPIEANKLSIPFIEISNSDTETEIIDLTLIPPPQTPDELDGIPQIPEVLPVAPSSFADENEQEKTSLDDFIANAIVPPPASKINPEIELTPEEINSFIIPPPPKSNDSTLERQLKPPLKLKSNSEVIKGTKSVSEIRNIFSIKNLSDARNSLILSEKKVPKTDSPKRKSLPNSKITNGNSCHVVEYPTVERKGMFSCCGKDKSKMDDRPDGSEQPHQFEESINPIPDVCEIRPPPRKKNLENNRPPARPPKTVCTPTPRPRSNSFSCPDNNISQNEVSQNHFNTLNTRKLNYDTVCEINDSGQFNAINVPKPVLPPQIPSRFEKKRLSPPPPILLPPKKPPLPPVPSIEVLKIKQNKLKQSPTRHASIGSPHFQRNLSHYKNFDNEHPCNDSSLNGVEQKQFQTLQNRHVRSNSESESALMMNHQVTNVMTLYSPQSNRKFNRPDLLRGAPMARVSSPVYFQRRGSLSPRSPISFERKYSRSSNYIERKDCPLPTSNSPVERRNLSPGVGSNDSSSPRNQNRVHFGESSEANDLVAIENLLRKTDVAVETLLSRLHAAAQTCQELNMRGGGHDIDETKFQIAREELTSCAVGLVCASRSFVGALGSIDRPREHETDIPTALASSLTPLRRLADLSQDLVRHTSAPLQTRNLVLRVHDVTAAFKELAGNEMADILHQRHHKSSQSDSQPNLEGQLALRAECLANVLATLLRSLRVFSP